jgi:hypothetical protein
MTLVLYLYRSRYPTSGPSKPWVIQGDRDILNQFIRAEEYSGLFGGCIQSRAKTPSGQVTGVWGVKTIKRFRRVLRERGAVFQQLIEEPPEVRIKSISKSASRPKGLGIEHFGAK